jgi:hypothetical protein
MPQGIIDYHLFAAAQNRSAERAYWLSRDEHTTGNGLRVPIYGEDGRSQCRLPGLPCEHLPAELRPGCTISIIVHPLYSENFKSSLLAVWLLLNT